MKMKASTIILLPAQNVVIKVVYKKHFYSSLEEFYPHSNPAYDMQKDKLLF